MKVQSAVAILSLLTLFVGVSASAAGATRCHVLTIEASNAHTGVDASIERYASIFRRAPFSAFDSFRLIDTRVVDLAAGAPKMLALPDTLGGRLELRRAVKGQFQLLLTITREGHKPVLIAGMASAGSPLFAAGMRSANGVWVFGIICDPQAQLIEY